jgi:hypothetical protein
MPTLAELKALVKNHKNDKPKLSAGKDALLMWASKSGLLEKKEDAPAPVAPVSAAKKTVKIEKISALPAILKKKMPEPVIVAPKVKKTKAAPEPEPVAPGRKASAFSAFMSANKGSGYSMKELSEQYKQIKNTVENQ